MIIRKGRTAVPFRRIPHAEPDQSVLWQKGEVKVAQFRLRVVAMFASNLLRWNAEAGRRNHPVWIRETVKKPEVLELAIRAFKQVPLGLLDTDSHVSTGVSSPARSSNQ